ncbi:pentatricopeptide repeat-containing protein At1g52620 [Gossypium hirsutum]|uniref:Dirigent protein n=1 Tax=Gossypium hirsutum TaxID=3635 RepID=A0ABM3AWB5_GOSHI|nr:pentatricopeptide repeat-containing protein At1g52620-like [Gossypium hirsutum]
MAALPINTKVVVLLVLGTSMVVFTIPAGKADDGLKQTIMSVYLHDHSSGSPDSTVRAVVGFPGKLWNLTKFGTLFVSDDPVTEGPDPESAPVGRGQGIFVTRSLDGVNTHVSLSIVFTNEACNGSTIQVQGNSDQMKAVREYGVVSGTVIDCTLDIRIPSRENVPPDAFIYVTLVDGFIRDGDLHEAKELFDIMIGEGMDPGVVGYNAMIKGFCKFRKMKEALLCVTRMIKAHLTPDQFTYSTIIDGYIQQHDIGGALRMFKHMVKRKCNPNVVTYTSLINGFCRNGDLSTAEKAFKEMQSCGLEPNVVTYTIPTGSFCKKGKLAKAVFYFESMLSIKCIPNEVTFNYIVNGFTNSPGAVLDNQCLEKSSFS